MSTSKYVHVCVTTLSRLIFEIPSWYIYHYISYFLTAPYSYTDYVTGICIMYRSIQARDIVPVTQVI